MSANDMKDVAARMNAVRERQSSVETLKSIAEHRRVLAAIEEHVRAGRHADARDGAEALIESLKLVFKL